MATTIKNFSAMHVIEKQPIQHCASFADACVVFQDPKWVRHEKIIVGFFRLRIPAL
jgi:hypothetical protein